VLLLFKDENVFLIILRVINEDFAGSKRSGKTTPKLKSSLFFHLSNYFTAKNKQLLFCKIGKHWKFIDDLEVLNLCLKIRKQSFICLNQIIHFIVINIVVSFNKLSIRK